MGKKKNFAFQVCSADTRRRTMSPSLCRSRCRSSASPWERPSSAGRPTPSIPSPCSPPSSWPEPRERRWASDGITPSPGMLRFAFFWLPLRSTLPKFSYLPTPILFLYWSSVCFNVFSIIVDFIWLCMAGAICTVCMYVLMKCKHHL